MVEDLTSQYDNGSITEIEDLEYLADILVSENEYDLAEKIRLEVANQ